MAVGQAEDFESEGRGAVARVVVDGDEKAGAIDDGIGRGGAETQVADAVGAAGDGGGVALDEEFIAGAGGGGWGAALDVGVVAGREGLLVETRGVEARGGQTECEKRTREGRDDGWAFHWGF